MNKRHNICRSLLKIIEPYEIVCTTTYYSKPIPMD